MEINKLEAVRKALVEALEAQQTADEQSNSDINKSSENALQEAIDAYVATAPQKTATIKLKGIALTHEAQGYSANLRPVSLLMKTDTDVNSLTDEQKAALERLGYVINGEQGA